VLKFKIAEANIPTKLREQFKAFMNEFKIALNTNIQQIVDYVQALQNVPSFKHLRP